MIRNQLLKNRTVLFCGAALVCVFGFSGCKKEQPPAAAPAQQVKAAPAQAKPVQRPVSSALSLTPPPTNQFDFSSKKDPFKPAVLVKAAPVQSADNEKKALKDSLPIHSLDVGQFKLIGIITGEKENRAMVTDTAGKGYVLRVGMTIGKNNGKVVSITSSGVDVLEQFKDENGRVRKENIKLTLPKKQ
jgi:type IV pilus assembly protein PilP